VFETYKCNLVTLSVLWIAMISLSDLKLYAIIGYFK